MKLLCYRSTAPPPQRPDLLPRTAPPLTARSFGASSRRVPAGRPDSGPLESGPQNARRAIQAQGAAPGLLRCSLRRPCGRGGDRRRRAGRGRARPGAEEAATSAELGKRRWEGGEQDPREARSRPQPTLPLRGPRTRFSLPAAGIETPRTLPCPTALALALVSRDLSFRFHSGIAPKEKITSRGPRGRGRCACKELEEES